MGIYIIYHKSYDKINSYSEMLHTLLGWGEGLMLLLGEEHKILLQMLAILEDKRRALVEDVAALPGSVVLAPDNLDGQYISPENFHTHFAASYRRTADILNSGDKYADRVPVNAEFARLKATRPLITDAGNARA